MAIAGRRSAARMNNTSIMDVWLAARITAPLLGTTSAFTISVLITRVKPSVHRTRRIDHVTNHARFPSPRDRGRLNSRVMRVLPSRRPRACSGRGGCRVAALATHLSSVIGVQFVVTLCFLA